MTKAIKVMLCVVGLCLLVLVGSLVYIAGALATGYAFDHPLPIFFWRVVVPAMLVGFPVGLLVVVLWTLDSP